MYVIDLQGNEFAVMTTYTVSKDLKGNHSLTATLIPNKPNRLYLDDIERMWQLVDDDGIKYRIIYVSSRGEGNEKVVDIKAIPSFFDEASVSRISTKTDGSMTAYNAFNQVFTWMGAYGYNYNFILEESFEALTWEGFGNHRTCLKQFQEILNRYDAEFFISGTTVHITKKIGVDTNHMYRHRLNASNIVEEVDASEYFTAGYGYADYGDGEGGEDWEDAKITGSYVSPLASILGNRVAPAVTNGNIKSRTVLVAAIKKIVDESLKISISATIRDLRKQNYPIGQSNIGDRVFVIDERIKLNEELRVVTESVTRIWTGEVVDVDLTFGSDDIVKRKKHEFNSSIQSIEDILKGIGKLPYSVLDNAVQQATQALKNAQTELIFPESGGILAVDKRNPNLVTLFNSAGIGVSSDGGRTFKNAITGLGIVAERIMAGSVQGLVISSSEFIGGKFSTTGSSGNIVIQNGLITTYEGGLRTSEMGGFGQRFYYRGNNVGRIATSYLTPNVNQRGLVFGLETASSFMAWSHRTNASDTDYSIKMRWLKGSGFAAYDKFLFSQAVDINGPTTIGNKLDVNGPTTIANKLKITNGFGIDADGNSTIGGRLSVDYTISSGPRSKMASGGNAARFGPNTDDGGIYMYVTTSGIIGISINGVDRNL